MARSEHAPALVDGREHRDKAKNDLRALRLQRGLSLEAMALIADVDVATISRIERRLTRPHSRTVVKLAQALGIGVKKLHDTIEQAATTCFACGQTIPGREPLPEVDHGTT